MRFFETKTFIYIVLLTSVLTFCNTVMLVFNAGNILSMQEIADQIGNIKVCK